VQINSWPGLIAVILAIISFYGMTYVVIALNVGWRFGYWLSSACFGALMVLLSIFWVLNITPEQAVGPQGAQPAWLPIGVGETVEQVEFNGETITAPASYPGGDWQQPEEDDARVDALNSAISNCLTTDPESLRVEEQEACAQAQELMPEETDIPVLEGAAVAVQPKTVDVRFASVGAELAAAIVRPVTTDVRVTEDPDGEELAEPFMVVAILDKGSVGLPSYMSLVIFVIYEAFHLWGLNRAERKRLSPAVV
jgi:hypothetical protein